MRQNGGWVLLPKISHQRGPIRHALERVAVGVLQPPRHSIGADDGLLLDLDLQAHRMPLRPQQLPVGRRQADRAASSNSESYPTLAAAAVGRCSCWPLAL